MDCKHERAYLLGVSDGIICRKCGRKFASFTEIEAETAPKAQPEPEKAAPVKRTRKKKEDA